MAIRVAESDADQTTWPRPRISGKAGEKLVDAETQQEQHDADGNGQGQETEKGGGDAPDHFASSTSPRAPISASAAG